MQTEQRCSRYAIRFRRFMRKGYGAFCSMHKVVNIGVISATTLFFALPDTAQAQQQLSGEKENSDSEVALEEIEVTASRAPISLSQAAKIVTVITAQEVAAAPVTSIQDLLEYAVGVDVRQRGEGGTQADVSIRGGTFDQIAVLLNGVNLSNPQTGHYSFDLPVNLSDIERIEIISGPASRLFGASAFAGAINVITKTNQSNSLTTDNYVGMHEAWKVEAGINHAHRRFSQRLSAGYASSGGYIDNTDYQQLNLFWQSEVKADEGDFRLQAGYNDKGYGANSFYSAAYPNQYDKTRRLFLSAGGETKGKIRIAPKVYWTKHLDRYELFRSNPADWYTGHNYHQTEVFGANLNATTDWIAGRTSVGAEFRNEGVRSNVLGKLMDQPKDVPFEKQGKYLKSDNRTNVSYFIEHTILHRRFTLSAGVLANYNSSLEQSMRFYPGIDLAYRLGSDVSLYGSWNRALRMPTFTDLYYESKVIKGNALLKPEESEAFEVGVKYATHPIRAYIAGFYRKGKNMIDWIKKNPEDIWESRNLTEVNNLGVETSLSLFPREWGNDRLFIRKFSLGYTFIHQEKDSEGYISNYALDYLKHKFTAQLSHDIWRGFSASWHLRWQDRAGSYTKYEALKPAYEEAYAPYCVLDVKLNWQRNRLNIYAEINNLFDVAYHDIGNIPQPGFWIKGGFSYTLPY